jgi:hypothetical protein
MATNVAALAAMLAFSAVAVGSAMLSPSFAQEASQDAMMKECEERAAVAFEQSPGEVMTLLVEKTTGGYRVTGQFPLEGDDITEFTCSFTASGVFESIGRD